MLFCVLSLHMHAYVTDCFILGGENMMSVAVSVYQTLFNKTGSAWRQMKTIVVEIS